MVLSFEELYEHEKQKIAVANDRLSEFEFGGGSTTDKRLFEMAAHNEFGQAGFAIAIAWEEFVKRTPLGDIPTGVWQPNIQITRRIKHEAETDHDRIRHEVVTGLVDGVKGYIREDGSRHEDPKKRIITGPGKV